VSHNIVIKLGKQYSAVFMKMQKYGKYLGFSYLITSCIIKLDILHKENLIQSLIVEWHKNSHGQFYAFYFWSAFFLQFSSYSLSTMSKSTIS